MARRVIVALAAGIIVALATRATVHAQDRNPADEVKAFLTAKGYTVDDVGYLADAQGQSRPDAVYVLMDAVGGDLDHPDLQTQVVWGFSALRQAYPRAETVHATLAYRQFWIFFWSSAIDLDQFMDRTLDGTTYWTRVRRQVRIYDRLRGTFTDEKSFTTNNQAGKDQTGKNFGSDPKNPVPTPVPGSTQSGTLWLEPSTTYLPNDRESRVVLMATLLDRNFAPAANTRLTFSYQAPGDNAVTMGAQNTDVNGAARAAVAGSRAFNSLLLRAATESQNSQVSIVVGTVPSRKTDQINAVVRGLTKQGYAGIEVDYSTQTRATGETTNVGYVEMRIASQSFDRSVFSQMSRAFGTLRTLFPKVNQLYVTLVYHNEGQDWQLMWSVQVAYWDQLVTGQIGENDFWRNLRYIGAYDENGNSLDDKNFLDQNFGAGRIGKRVSVTRPLESTVTAETWGDQWHGQEFVVLPGSYADTFTVEELTGNATAVQLFQSPDFVTPILTYTRDDSPEKLRVQLGQGQYLFAVVASSAPASARATYVEHLPQ